MNTSFNTNRLSRLALAASLVGLAGVSQATVVTVSASWDASNVTGPASSGASSFTAAASALNSLSSLSWDDLTEIGVTKAFTFNLPFSVNVTNVAPASENYFKATPVIFSGAGTAVAPLPFTTPLFTQSFTVENLGSSAKMTYNGSDGTVLYTSDFGGKTYSWSAKFVAQASVTQPFLTGSTSYIWPDAQLNVTLLSAVPEPTTAMLLALGLAPLVIASRRRRQG